MTGKFFEAKEEKPEPSTTSSIPAPNPKGRSVPSTDAGSQCKNDTLLTTEIQSNEKNIEEDEHHKNLGSWDRMFYYRLLQHRLPSWFPQRYALCLYAHIGFVLLYVIRSSMSVAIVKMTTSFSVRDGDHLASGVDFDWNLKEQGIILSSFFFGYILTQIPGGCLAARHGGRKVFGMGLLFAGIVSICTPLSSKFGFYGLVLARILCGLAEGVTYPAMHAMWNSWAPPSERASLVSGAFAGAYLGAALSMAQFVNVETLPPWQSVFYLTGVFAIGWSYFWFCWGQEYPENDPMVPEKELLCLKETVGLQSEKSDKSLSVPWLKILISPRVWAINICHFAVNWGFYTILIELPTYLHSALHYEVQTVAPVASLPFVAMALSTTFGGCLVDRTLPRYLNITNTRRVTITLTFLAQMMFFFLAGKASGRSDFIGYIVGALTFAGLSWAGFGANHLDIAPDYASVLLGISNTIGTLPGIISPLLTGYLVEDKDDPHSWSVVFLISGYIYLGAAVIYLVFGSGELQDWANPNESRKLKTYNTPTSAAEMESGSGAE